MDDWVTWVPCSKERYHAVAQSVVRERAGKNCLTLGATQSHSQGTPWGGGPIMMTTWEIDSYPLTKVEQTNPGHRLQHDGTDVWRFWINSDHAWRAP